jgi:CDP-diacylglycerol--glycerol-3-phosphate 3-phosphatidyltransferase
VIKDKYGHKLDKWIQTIFPFLFKSKIDPNVLTVLGAAVCVCGAVAFGMGEFVLGGFLLWGGGMCDLVDGAVARHHGNATDFGAFLDSTLDRLVDMAVLIALVIFFAQAGDTTTALLASAGLIASVLTSYTKANAEAKNVDLPGGIIERGERIVLICAGGILGIMVPALWLLAVGSTATVVQRFTGARRAMARESAGGPGVASRTRRAPATAERGE